MKSLTRAETYCPIKANGILIGCSNVQERCLTAFTDAVRHRPGQPAREALPARRRVRAYRADLGPALGVEAFTRHRDELSLSSEAEIGAEQAGAPRERPGLGALSQVDHVVGVGRAEHRDLGVGLIEQRVGGDHLDGEPLDLDVPASRRRRRQQL